MEDLIFMLVILACYGGCSVVDCTRAEQRDAHRAECVKAKTVAECRELFP